MESKDCALVGTEKASSLWGVVYLFVFLAFFNFVFYAWDKIHVQPFKWRNPIQVGFIFILLPFPLLIGLAFRRTLKNELGKDLLSERTYQICDYWIALLLFTVYVVLEIYNC